MATTRATLTLSAPDFTGGATFSASTTFLKAGSSVGLTQFTGISRVEKDSATADISIVAAGDYADNQAGKLYFKNTSTTGADTFILMEVGSNVIIGRLFPDDWMLIPFDGTEDIKATTSDNGMSYEFGIFHEG
tara:strand:- start:1978 stop:2376 length:399 start_codon:yes stop_codon:yes gene_type:complete